MNSLRGGKIQVILMCIIMILTTSTSLTSFLGSTFVSSRNAIIDRTFNCGVIKRCRYGRIRLSENMCICINCKWVTSCKAYHFIETNHKQPHINKEPDFMPRKGSPTIMVTIHTKQNMSPKEEIGQTYSDTCVYHNKDAELSEATNQEKVSYNNSEITTEYDVVKCADFDEEHGCWVNNMPDKIKRVNPNFVPS